MDIVLYSIVLTGFWLFFVVHAKGKYLVGLILFWLYAMPVLYNAPLRFPFFDFTVNSSRLLFLGVSILFLCTVRTRRVKNARRKLYEVWLLLLILSVVLSESLSIFDIGISKYVSDITYALTFALTYYVVKWGLKSENDVQLLRSGVLLFAIASSLVAFIQFFVDPSFFHLGVFRNAFSEYSRANGLFPNEFDQSLFLVIALLLNWRIFKQRKIVYFLILLFGCAVFFTMHRISWLMYVLCIFAIIYFSTSVSKQRTKSFVLLAMMLTAFLLLIWAIPWNDIFRTNPFLDDLVGKRLSTDTWSIRMEYDLFALQIIKDHPIGLGSYGSEYASLAYYYALPFNRNTETLQLTPYIIHNSYLAAGVKYGWLGLVSFLCFFVYLFIHFLRLYWASSKEWIIPTVMVGAYLFLSVTQDLTFAVELQSLLILGVILGIYAHQEQTLSSPLTSRKQTFINPYVSYLHKNPTWQPTHSPVINQNK